MESLGQRIRRERQRLRIPLRRFARKVEVTAPHISDIELDKRRPSTELLRRIADALQVEVAILEQLDTRVRPELRQWIEERPVVGQLLRRLRDAPNPERLLYRLRNINGPVLVTWESEIRAIAADAAAWLTETGGDLFGLWGGPAVIYLATRAGPGALRDATHFRLDIDYLRELSNKLSADWGLRYLGDWHSHHRLGLMDPSAGDRRRIEQVAARNGFSGMAEIIVTLDDGAGPSMVKLHPWVYTNGEMLQPKLARLEVFPGVSPVRDALIAREALHEQELQRWAEIPAERIIGINERRDEQNDELTDPYSSIVERLFDEASQALEKVCGRPIERHATAFGAVLAAPVDDMRLVGFAVSREWPCAVLEIDWIDRSGGTAEPIAFSQPISLRVPGEIVAQYRAVRQHKASELRVDVDPGTN